MNECGHADRLGDWRCLHPRLQQRVTHPAVEGLAAVGGLDEVLKLQDAVGHKVVVSDGSVVEDGHLELVPVHHVQAELLVVRRRVGLLFGVRLPDLVVVHLHHDVGVEGRGGLVEHDGVAEGEGCWFQAHRLTDPQLQVTVKLHLCPAGLGTHAGI